MPASSAVPTSGAPDRTDDAVSSAPARRASRTLLEASIAPYVAVCLAIAGLAVTSWFVSGRTGVATGVALAGGAAALIIARARPAVADRRDRGGVYRVEIEEVTDEDRSTEIERACRSERPSDAEPQRLAPMSSPPFLVARSRAAAMFNALGSERRTEHGAVDLEAIVRLAAECEVPERIPAMTRRRWVPIDWLFVDAGPACAPYRHDFVTIQRTLLRANPGATVRHFDADPLHRVVDDYGDVVDPAVVEAPLPGSRLLVLTDLCSGRYRSVSPVTWLEFDRRLARAGSSARYATPYPLERIPPALCNLRTMCLGDLSTSRRNRSGSAR
ncbi:MAG: hypothetical protein R2705_21320 [Ilumatobacteraceae bacterium]